MGGRSSRTVVHKHITHGVPKEQYEALHRQLVNANNERNRAQQRFDQRMRDLQNQSQKNQREFNQQVKNLTDQHRTQLQALERRQRQEAQRMRQQVADMERRNRDEMRNMRLGELRTRRTQMTTMYGQYHRPYCDHVRNVAKLEAQLKKVRRKLKKEEKLVRNFAAEINDPNMLRLVLYGPTGHGKSTLANRIWGDRSRRGDEGPFKVGKSVEAETSVIKKEIIPTTKRLYYFPVSLTDQPGVHDTKNRDREHANNLISYLRGIGFVHAIGLVKLFHQRRLDDGYQSMLRNLERMLGRPMWRHVVIICTAVEGPGADDWPQYSQEFVAYMRRLFNLSPQDAPLPIIGLSNYDGYRGKCEQLMKVVARLGRFQCVSLRSPLEALKASAQLKQNEVDAAIRGRDEVKANLDTLLQQIRECETLIKRADRTFRDKFKPPPEPRIVVEEKDSDDEANGDVGAIQMNRPQMDAGAPLRQGRRQQSYEEQLQEAMRRSTVTQPAWQQDDAELEQIKQLSLRQHEEEDRALREALQRSTAIAQGAYGYGGWQAGGATVAQAAAATAVPVATAAARPYHERGAAQPAAVDDDMARVLELSKRTYQTDTQGDADLQRALEQSRRMSQGADLGFNARGNAGFAGFAAQAVVAEPELAPDVDREEELIQEALRRSMGGAAAVVAAGGGGGGPGAWPQARAAPAFAAAAEWECQICTMRNDAHLTKCSVCEAQKP